MDWEVGGGGERCCLRAGWFRVVGAGEERVFGVKVGRGGVILFEAMTTDGPVQQFGSIFLAGQSSLSGTLKVEDEQISWRVSEGGGLWLCVYVCVDCVFVFCLDEFRRGRDRGKRMYGREILFDWSGCVVRAVVSCVVC